MKIALILTSIFYIATVSNGAKILLLTPVGSRSHKIAFEGIIDGLAEKGHQVTVVSTHKDSQPKKNVRDIVLQVDNIIDAIVKDLFTDAGKDKVIVNLFHKAPEVCIDALATKEVQELKKEKFDLILFSLFIEGCFSSLLHHFKVPFILISSGGLLETWYDVAGQVYFTSLTGMKRLDGYFPFDFIYRLKSTVMFAIMRLSIYFYTHPKMEALCKQRGLCPNDMPPYRQIYRNSSLYISTSIRTLEYPPQPSMPHIIYMGGSHCRPGKPLPNDLEDWMKGSGDYGVILFAMGSSISTSEVPEENLRMFVRVFSKLNQRIIWKWDQPMNDLPSNIKQVKWLPQQDILAHPKTKLFITHGGLGSCHETLYHGVPMIGMPVYIDQFKNLKDVVHLGYGIQLDWKELTEETFKSAIQSAVNNKTLKIITQEKSKIMKDLPITNKDNAVFWIEYVLRHNGAKHLRSPLYDLSTIELYNIDVWFTIVTIISILCIAMMFILKFFISFFISKKQSNKRKNE